MRYLNYINGEWKKPVSGEYIENRNPHNWEEVLGEFPMSAAEDVYEAVQAAKKAFAVWKKLSFQQRASYLLKAAEYLKANLEEVGRDLTLEEGKTLVEGIGETQRAISILEYYAAEGRQPVGEVVPSANAETFLYTTRVPVGPIGLITPWNFPIAIPVWKMAPALIYGNTVVIKPAEITPKSVYHVMKAFEAAGLPAGVVNCVFGSGSVVGSEIVEHPDIKAVSFTGSNTVGLRIQERATAKGKKVQLEMGGKNPLIVLADADLNKAVNIAISGAFRSTGQKCTATSRVIVEEGIYDAFRDLLVERTKALKVGNPLEKDTFMGPAVSKTQRDGIMAMIEAGKQEATLLCGGEAPADPELANGFYVLPTIFENVSRDARIAREEIFGPVIALFKVKNYEEAVGLANDTEYGLSSAICTNNLTLAQRFVDDIEAGIVHVNSETAGAEPQVPFGGCKNSSTGSREQGKAAIEFYTQVKTVYMDRM
ncbi:MULTISPECIES: aldehyde dehydrogenase family protein [Aneurinibacillus]|uniref:Aldehyde dehydrogenase (NAD+) n=1 Tax=Aneurinibacillus thermoaerophilus TaxID=143495 RepID=A0A1G7XMU8_ANETH|nr:MULTISPECIES: aldehyde dehydrogenase family protein [Aneurinibacillus]AMA73652.1 aldehyde dehydrogenase [Aneurinibacillus sp. XH2]MED0675054.1 aldehyde dehydrogenase family protein [Aneurinibacillus thermoaerophilus]MED0679544.1 aldehyde dehydrogenase family protein [Aneurinibacillus thermoaerophilus]MED0737456.1 aldehyde dehydrogenase family protein [Aneurinibacillus thermoaerophilus]MED0756306.1 aldehyde dehydrogenase family protein [Aneurinibacillus thermoaerophilus]